jgi:hypothetical protein
MYIGLHAILVLFLKKLDFFRHIFKNAQISNFMKIRSLGAELFHVDRRTDGRKDMTKLIVAFCNFANAPKMRYKIAFNFPH